MMMTAFIPQTHLELVELEPGCCGGMEDCCGTGCGLDGAACGAERLVPGGFAEGLAGGFSAAEEKVVSTSDKSEERPAKPLPCSLFLSSSPAATIPPKRIQFDVWSHRPRVHVPESTSGPPEDWPDPNDPCQHELPAAHLRAPQT